MFFGKVVSKDQSFAFTADDENVEHEVLSITNLTLAPSSKVILFLTSGRSISLRQERKLGIFGSFLNKGKASSYN